MLSLDQHHTGTYMNVIKHLLVVHKYLVAFMLIYIIGSLIFYKDFGITADEQLEYESGKHYIAYFFNKGTQDLPDISPRHFPENSSYLRLYTGILSVLNINGYYEWYHLLNLFTASVMFLVGYFLLFSHYKNPKIAIWAPIFILLTPRIIGDFPTNTKDIPFATLYMLGILLTYLTSYAKHQKKVLFTLAIVIGLAQSTRLIGISLIFVFLLFRIIYKDQKQNIKNLLGETIFLIFVSLGVMVIILPVLHTNTLQKLQEIILNSAQFNFWNNYKFYNGMFLDKTQNPLSYPYVWIFITLPLFQLLLLIFGCVKISSLKANKLFVLLCLTLIINLGALTIINPVLYNGPRHFLYILCTLSTMTAVVFVELQNRKLKILSVLLMPLTVYSLITLHPYQYIYFGEHVLGLRGAQNKYELDYWGATYSEAAQKLANTIELTNPPANVYACNVRYVVAYYSLGKFQVTELANADYIICDSENEKLNKFSGPTIFNIERHGVILNTVRKNEYSPSK